MYFPKILEQAVHDGPITLVAVLALIVVYEALRLLRKRDDDK